MNYFFSRFCESSFVYLIDFYITNNRSNIFAESQILILICAAKRLLFIKTQFEINLSLLYL